MGAGASNSARDLDPWLCYMCQPLHQYGVLKRRHDWSLKLQEFFVNDNGQEFVSPGSLNIIILIIILLIIIFSFSGWVYIYICSCTQYMALSEQYIVKEFTIEFTLVLVMS